MAFKNIHLIVNPAAGQPQPILHGVNKAFHEHGIHWEVTITRPDITAAELTRNAIDAGADLIVSYGGDGTVTDVVNGMMGTDIPLAILHGGTGNALANELGIPREIEAAAALIAGEHTLWAVDVGKATPADNADKVRYFLLRASVGLQTEIVESADRESKDRFGNLAYVFASLRALADGKPRQYHLTIDGEEVSGEGLTCMITNSSAVGGPNSFKFAQDVSPFDGVLNAFILDTSFESVMSALGSALGTDPAPFKQHWTGREITVRTDTPQAITLDGEPFTETPLQVAVMPDALRIVVPVG